MYSILMHDTMISAKSEIMGTILTELLDLGIQSPVPPLFLAEYVALLLKYVDALQCTMLMKSTVIEIIHMA